MDIALRTGLDILVVAIIALCIVIGAKKGLVRSVIGLFGKIISLVAAFFLSENLGVYLDQHYIHAPMRQWLINQLSPTAENVDASLNALDLNALFGQKPKFFTDIVDLLHLDFSQLMTKYLSMREGGAEQAKAAIINEMISPLSATVSRITAFIIIFIVCSVGVAVLWWLSDLIINLPIVKQLDTLGGAVFGALNGVLIVFLTVAVLGVTSQYILKDKSYEDRQTIVSGTFIYKHFKKINPVTDLLSQDDIK
ncbi:MAG: CvpA family protein [Clostridia bacterium]|nr:CvpA family protein [Clostridia bacterium]